MMIEKPTIIITSLGRTGTKFFSKLFAGIIPESLSIHEPDVFNYGNGYDLHDVYEQMQISGTSNLIIRKSLGRWSLIKLSDARLIGGVSDNAIAKKVVQQRYSFINKKPQPIYVESNIGYYGLVDILNNVYHHYRVLYIIRDGRDWVRSHLNWGRMYNKGWLRRQVAHTWPTAPEISHDPYGNRWATMTRFERLCWAWNTLNRYALQAVETNPQAKLFRFEDIFKASNRYDHLAELVQFATTFPDYGTIPTQPLEGWLERQIHQSSGDFPKWHGWSAEQKEQFKVICGELMLQLGYDFA